MCRVPARSLSFMRSAFLFLARKCIKCLFQRKGARRKGKSTSPPCKYWRQVMLSLSQFLSLVMLSLFCLSLSLCFASAFGVIHHHHHQQLFIINNNNNNGSSSSSASSSPTALLPPLLLLVACCVRGHLRWHREDCHGTHRQGENFVSGKEYTRIVPSWKERKSH